MLIINRLDNHELTQFIYFNKILSFLVHFSIKIPKVIVPNLSIHHFSYTHYTMHIVSYATTAQSRFQMVVKYKTVSLRHKHNPETLFIHITQCIHIVLAFTSNARQLIIHLKHFYQQKFYFQKFHFFFQIFVPLCLILFYFFPKKKKFPKFVTVHCTVHSYCSQVLFPKLQYNLFIAIHFQQCLPAMYCNTIHLPLQYPSFPLQYTFILLQYNSLPYLQASLQYNSLYCNTIFQPLSPPIAIHFLSQKDYIAIQSVSHQTPLLQYNSNPTSLLLQYKTKPTTLPRLQYNFPIAIQSQANYTLLLQYNCNTIFFSSPLSCNTIARLQYNCKIAIQFFFFTIQLGSSPNPFMLHFLSRFFFFF